MFATGSQVRGWLMVEVRGAWGDDGIHESEFGKYVPSDWKDQLKRRRIRAVCIRSQARAEASEVRVFACAARRPGKGPAPLWQRDVPSLAEVLPAARELSIHQSPEGGWEQVPGPLILVCTNGRHDQCCANLGRPLIRALRESPWSDRVWECSHVGGDRFAPNVVLLPDSLYFGRVESGSVGNLLDAFDQGRIDLAHFRGRTSYSLTEQAVEHFTRREFGLEAVDDVVIDHQTAQGAFPVRFGDRLVHVRVRRRLVPSPDPLTCKGQPNQLVPTFTLESIT